MRLLAKTFARAVGEGNGEEQAELLNAIGVAIWDSCRLDEHGRRFLRTIGVHVDPQD